MGERVTRELVLQLQVPSQNVTNHEHWSKRSKRRKEAEWVVLAAKLQADKDARGTSIAGVWPRLGEHVEVHVTSYRCGQLLDYGNLVGGAKQLIDALVVVGLASDDSPEYMTQRYEQQRVAHRNKQHTRIRLSWEPGVRVVKE